MKGRVALITGASRGIGKAISEVLHAEGAVLLTPSRSELDLASNSSIDTYLAKIGTRVDILVNNAGVNVLASVQEYSDSDWSSMLQVNLTAQMRLMRGLVPGMKERGYGRIVNISSVWGLVSKPKRFPYSVSKAGVNGMTRAAAVELAPFGILVNAVAPGFVDTELTRKNNSASEISAIEQLIPARRLAMPAEIAAVVSFLASSKNTYITGQTIAADGGYTCL